MNLDEEIKKLIQNHIGKLKSHEGKKFIEINKFYPQQQREKDLDEIPKKLMDLKSVYLKTEERIKKLKTLIPDITEQTTLCAVYLIYGKILQTWRVIFLLTERGYNFETMELNRSIIENLDLIHTFYLDKDSAHLGKWFQGEIITNEVSRSLVDEYITKNGVNTHGQSPYDMANTVYRGFSKYTHCSYVALLESIDVYNEDFDWDGYSGTHYSLKHIDALESTMTSTLIALKYIYLELKDMESYAVIDKILLGFAGPMDEQSLQELIAKT